MENHSSENLFILFRKMLSACAGTTNHAENIPTIYSIFQHSIRRKIVVAMHRKKKKVC